MFANRSAKYQGTEEDRYICEEQGLSGANEMELSAQEQLIVFRNSSIRSTKAEYIGGKGKCHYREADDNEQPLYQVSKLVFTSEYLEDNEKAENWQYGKPRLSYRRESIFWDPSQDSE